MTSSAEPIEFDTDLVPVVAGVALRLQRAMPRRTTPHPHYDLHKLQDPAFLQLFALEVYNSFSSLAEEDWQLFKQKS